MAKEENLETTPKRKRKTTPKVIEEKKENLLENEVNLFNINNEKEVVNSQKKKKESINEEEKKKEVINEEPKVNVNILTKEKKEEKEEAILNKQEINISANKNEIKKTQEMKLSPNIEKFLNKKKQKKAKALKKQEKKETKEGLILNRYEADPNVGLSSDIVEKRKQEDLTNQTKTGSTKSIKKIIISNLITFFNILTFAIAGVLISVGAFTDLFFVVIVSANIIIGIIQEIKAKNIIDKLSLLQAPTAFVIRDGKRSEIAVSEVVLDDILVLEAGKQIPADSILLNGNVEVNESLLTGESDAIIKKQGDTLYSGSFVVSGNCKARVNKVGKDNYISRLSGEAKLYKKPKSDLLHSLNIIIYIMAIIIIPIGVLLFYMQYFINGVEYITAIRKTAGAMIGMIPSGLMLLSSVALAVGVIRLAQNKVMVQELYCIEMLARVNVLCLDKTGTITDGTMSVKDVIEYENGFGITTKVVINGMLNALKENNLTQKALEERFGSNKKIKYHSLIHFSSQRKYNAVSFERYGTFIMGAPEFVLKDNFIDYKKEVDNYSRQGYRVLALAHKEGFIENETLPEGDIKLVALILIEDNIRPDAIETISYFKQSGVEVKVISGDNPLTVAKISERAGISNAKECISLDGMSDEDVARAATRYTVFGRVSPDQKRILVRALKEAGKTVAMTGDGVNDILALREADCSIAMASGSEAARNASHLVLIDSNFNSMPKVVAEGRRVINNVSRVACLFLTKTIFSLLLALQALNSGGIYPISTVQLSIIDFFVVGIPAFFLVLEPNNNEVDSRFLPNIIKGALPGAITILICSMITFQLVEYLNYDFMTSSTIIIVVATNTCLMVLFKVCKPFNRLRKVICGCSYSLFILCIIFLPSLFEIRPIFKFMEYNSDTVEITRLDSIPQIAISEDYNFVLDGIVYDTKSASGYREASSENGILTAYIDDNTVTRILKDGQGWQIPNPVLSVDMDNNLYAGGFNTNLVDFTNRNLNKITLDISENGDVSICSVGEDGTLTEVTHEPIYNVLPKISVSNGGYLVINGIDRPDIEVDFTTIDSISLDKDLNVLVNGNLITYFDSNTSQNVQLKISKPNVSLSENNYIILDAQTINSITSNESINVNLSQLGYSDLNSFIEADLEAEGFSDKLIQANGSYYRFRIANSNGNDIYLQTNVRIITPNIEFTTADHYIINGEYTNYQAVSDGGNSQTTVNVTEDGYLTINDMRTDYKADYSIQVGGVVQRLSIPALLILVTLCLASAPLMRILTGAVPWLKQTIKAVQNVLSKF